MWHRDAPLAAFVTTVTGFATFTCAPVPSPTWHAVTWRAATAAAAPSHRPTHTTCRAAAAGRPFPSECPPGPWLPRLFLARLR